MQKRGSSFSVSSSGEARPCGPRGKIEPVDTEHADALAWLEELDEQTKAYLPKHAILHADSRTVIIRFAGMVSDTFGSRIRPLHYMSNPVYNKKVAAMLGELCYHTSLLVS